MNADPQETYLSRGINHLGALGTLLRDLTGTPSLLRELVQNADDAGASVVTFDVGDDALVVDNNAQFRPCSALTAPVCPETTARRPSCDFHNIRNILGGEKRQRPDSTGAFGIGFTSVYQVTDHPELISNGQHWTLDELAVEGQRIRVCPGCVTCRHEAIEGTRLVLPWARKSSEIRMRLDVEPTEDETIARFPEELRQEAKTAILFLRHVRRISIRRGGAAHAVIELRLPSSDVAHVVDGQDSSAFLLLRGDFEIAAAKLKQEFVDPRDQRRRAEVAIAVPTNGSLEGRFFAFLPTDQQTGVPLHLQADFFPATDRRSIHFDGATAIARWNRAAIEAMGAILARSLPALRTSIGGERLLDLVSSLFHLAGTTPITPIRKDVLKAFIAGSFVPIAGGRYGSPGEVRMLSEEAGEASEVLQGLGIPLLPPELARHRAMLLQCGVQDVDGPDIKAATARLKLPFRIEVSQAPALLQSPANREILLRFLAILCERRKWAADFTRYFHDLPGILGRDDSLYSFNEVYRADSESRRLFEDAVGKSDMVDSSLEGQTFVEKLCPAFDYLAAIVLLEERKGLPGGALGFARKLLAWFEAKRPAGGSVTRQDERLAALPLFASNSTLKPLNALRLPGGFSDPLGLSNVVDLDAVGVSLGFLRSIGGKELSFPDYVLTHLCPAFNDPARAEQRPAILRLLVKHQDLLDSAEEAWKALSGLSLVPCEDGTYRKPSEVYQGSPSTRDLLGGFAHFAAELPGSGGGSWRGFLERLSVSSRPYLQDLLRRLRTFISGAPDEAGTAYVERLVRYLFDRLEKESVLPAPLEPLRTLEWLPAKDDASCWYAPSALITIPRAHLCRFVVTVLGLPPALQNRTGVSHLFPLLGIRQEPTTEEVVKHLRLSAGRGEAVHPDVYKFLQAHQTEKAVGSLRGEACICIPSTSEGGGRYVRPNEVFLYEHPFGMRRLIAGPGLREFWPLFAALGSKEKPEWTDAAAVLLEIGASGIESDRPVSETDATISRNCWELLARAFTAGVLSPETLRQHVAEGRSVLNVFGHPKEPQEVLLSDRFDLQEAFGEEIRVHLVSEWPGTMSALSAAGVRRLSQVITVEVQPEDGLFDFEVTDRLRRRHLQIARVIPGFQAALTNEELPPALQGVRDLEIWSAEAVVGLRTLRWADRTIRKPRRDVALLDRNTNRLFFQRGLPSFPWCELARELALALDPASPPAPLAIALRTVLEPNDDDEARRTLDQLGYPRVKLPESVRDHVASEVVNAIGVENDGPVPLNAPDSEGGAGPEKRPATTQAPEQQTPSSPGGARGTEARPPGPEPEYHVAGPAPEADGSGEVGRGEESNEEDPDGDGVGGHDHSHDGPRRALRSRTAPPGSRVPGSGSVPRWSRGPGERGPSMHGERRPASMMRSVVEWSPEPSTIETQARQDARREIERIGVAAVVNWEQARGRQAIELEDRPGYDIRSEATANATSGFGVEIRLIEVKSLSGYWDGQWVRMTRNEYEAAQAEQGRYWLYVVENCAAHPRIIPIRNPSGHVTEYLFDPGWAELATAERPPG